MLDNSVLVAKFVPERDDGDTFIYTEMLDRAKKKGNNGQRLLKTFYHRSQEEFWEQWETIKKLCDLSRVRACTRLAPRSYKKVGREFTRLVVETALTENWAGMKTLYNRACGIVTPIEKLWLWDVDAEQMGVPHWALREVLMARDVFVAAIPSKTGMHLISAPFDRRGMLETGIACHKDNPTNLYIPDGAD